MTTTFSVEIRKESGFTYAKAVGVEGNGDNTAKAVAHLMDLLGQKLSALSGAARHNALSDSGVIEMALLQGVLSPKEAPAWPSSMVCKK